MNSPEFDELNKMDWYLSPVIEDLNSNEISSELQQTADDPAEHSIFSIARKQVRNRMEIN